MWITRQIENAGVMDITVEKGYILFESGEDMYHSLRLSKVQLLELAMELVYIAEQLEGEHNARK